ncbi:MAG: alpha-L-fucosidase [Alistipes sp.]|nr:alpha-L-fucosidase [Alistipes sp.]
MTLKLRILLLITALNIGCSTTPDGKLYVQRATLPEDATIEQKIDIASRVVPSKRQLAWQQMEFTAFLHFGINTFTDNEWGDGTDSPTLFNPTELDCEQWVRTLKDAGFKMAILTAKHHDGFCLWQTATTEYSVKSSPWREGKGDVVRELSEACRKQGLKFGVYLSPWDRNAPSYGDSPAYNSLFIAQLSELLTNYGRVDEVWFDGACGEGKNGKRQEYDWETILNTIHTLQPDAVTAIMGDDIRWVGNEGGLGRATEWSVTPFTPLSYSHSHDTNIELDIEEMSKDLGSRALIARAKQLYWYPSEVDVSIRPGWFYHTWQDDKVRTLANLVDIYFNSVGCNSVLLLNIPPDRRGLIHEIDATRIKELSSYIAQMYAKNYLRNGSQRWHSEEGESREFRVDKGAVVNTLLLAEDITQGQRVESFKVEALINGKWHHLTQGTTIGYKRLLRFSDSTPSKIRVTITATRATAHISEIGLYYAEPLLDHTHTPRISDIATDGWMTLNPDAKDAIDGDITTTWRTEGLSAITVDMGSEYEISGFCYAPTSGELSGTIYRYDFYISTDNVTWQRCDVSGEFSNIKHNPTPYYVHFGTNYKARYFKLEPLEEIEGRTLTTIGEIGVVTTK